MQIIRENNIDVRRTVIRAVNNHPEFHFFVDELTKDGCMPTYAGIADEKYTYDSMDDGFFEFIERKIASEGIYLRICYLTGEITGGEAVFTIEIAGDEKTFGTNDLDSVHFIDLADYGITIRGDESTLGATVDEAGQTPYFAEFGSGRPGGKYLSLENPLNRFIIALIDDFLRM